MSADIATLDNFFNWSLNQFSKEFGIARETVGRRLRDANIKPSGERHKYPVYRVRDAAEAILMPQISGGFINDPQMMAPKERSDWFKSENERLKFERDSGLSVDSDDVRVQMAEIAKMGISVIESLPDILERDFDMQPSVIVDVEKMLDGLRQEWAEKLVGNT